MNGKSKVRQRMKTIVMTIDVETDYPPYLASSSLGVTEALPGILGLLESAKVPADVFLLAELCRTHRSLAKNIVDQGFRLGSHSVHHRLLCMEDFETQWREVSESKKLLEFASGVKVMSFRAPNFCFNEVTLRCLEKSGYSLDSSVLPGRTMKKRFRGYIYDYRDAPRHPYHPSANDVKKKGNSPILEFPATENPIVRAIPIGGGFLNTYGVDKTLEAASKAEVDTVVTVLHPWEFVELHKKFPRLPRWIKDACRSDLTPISDFLKKAISNGWRFSTLEEVADVKKGRQDNVAESSD